MKVATYLQALSEHDGCKWTFFPPCYSAGWCQREGGDAGLQLIEAVTSKTHILGVFKGSSEELRLIDVTAVSVIFWCV